MRLYIGSSMEAKQLAIDLKDRIKSKGTGLNRKAQDLTITSSWVVYRARKGGSFKHFPCFR